MYYKIIILPITLTIIFGFEKIWNVENPFGFMESISMEGKTNFFESRPTQY